jgi:Mg-chelatase subunit ChlD
MSQRSLEISRRTKNTPQSASRASIEIHPINKAERTTTLTPSYVYLVMDCSGSMAGENLQQARRGALDFAGSALAKGYYIGLIKFHSSATHVCDPVKELLVLKQHLDGMEAGTGSTNMADAITLAHQKLKIRNGSLAMVIVTDGIPDSVEAALTEAEKAKNDDIDIIAIGTDDADRNFLKKLASRSDLGMKVTRDQLRASISTSANLLGAGKGDHGQTLFDGQKDS